MRIFFLLLLTCSLCTNAENLAGDWYIDLHLMTLNEDGSFYASGVEPIDDQYGTYRTQKNKIYFTYTMYDMLVKASYGYAIDEDGKLLLFDQLGHTLEYTRN